MVRLGAIVEPIELIDKVAGPDLISVGGIAVEEDAEVVVSVKSVSSLFSSMDSAMCVSLSDGLCGDKSLPLVKEDRLGVNNLGR